jgi:hypothetical protein
MKASTPKSTTAAKAAKPGRYVPTTSPATKSAIEKYRQMRAAAGKPVLKIH